jgi:cobalt/nickel transport system permease protein
MRYRKGWIALAILALLTPLGIVSAGGAWGEWGLDGVRERSGVVPEGMRRSAAGAHDAPLGDYAVPGLGGSSFREGLGTVAAAFAGAGATALAAYGIGRVMRHGGGS